MLGRHPTMYDHVYAAVIGHCVHQRQHTHTHTFSQDKIATI